MLHICRPRQFQRTWLGSESAQWLQTSGIREIPGTFVMPKGMPIMPTWANDMALHIYRPRRFHWTWFGENPPSGYWVTASAKFWPDKRPDGWRAGVEKNQRPPSPDRKKCHSEEWKFHYTFHVHMQCIEKLLKSLFGRADKKVCVNHWRAFRSPPFFPSERPVYNK